MKKILSLLISIVLISGCTTFAEIKAEDFIYDYDGVISAYYGLEVVNVPSKINNTTIKEIGDGAFVGLEISSVNIDNGIEKIGKSAFESSEVIYVDIASTIKNVEDNAFKNCSNLEYVVLNSDDITFGDGVFMGCGYVEFSIPCTANEDILREKITQAKGNSLFYISKMHTALSESMTEKDIFGENMFYCSDCGFKGSKYLEDIKLPFTDVSTDAWYYPYVATAYDYTILSGKSETIFDPNAGLTCAEAAKIAACIQYNQTGGEHGFVPYGNNWYDVYVDYCHETGIIEEGLEFNWRKNATRAEMAYMFSHCDMNTYYINDVPYDTIPDVDENTPFAYEIYDLYNKGIAVGSNEYYAYYPNSEVKRSEAAALVSRILCSDMRIALEEFPRIEMLDGPGMVYDDSLYRTKYANCLSFDEIDGYPYWAVAYLGKGEKGEEMREYYINKLFKNLTKESIDEMQHFDFEGDYWFLVVPRYCDKNDIVPNYDESEKKSVYSGEAFTIKCNLSDNPNDSITIYDNNEHNFSPQIDKNGKLIVNDDIWDITEY
ncbi:MAG: leucine-rich repeat protein [Lachnospirales bacterium]